MSQLSLKLSILLYSLLGFRPLMQVEVMQDLLNLDKVNNTVYNTILVCVFIYWFAKVSLPVYKKWRDEIRRK